MPKTGRVLLLALILLATGLRLHSFFTNHFHTDEAARALDDVFIDRLRRFEWEELWAALSTKRTEACGGGPVAAAMVAAGMLGARRCDILRYATSGDVSGDRERVVGYVSAAMIREKSESTGATGAHKRNPRMNDGGAGDDGAGSDPPLRAPTDGRTLSGAGWASGST